MEMQVRAAAVVVLRLRPGLRQEPKMVIEEEAVAGPWNWDDMDKISIAQ